MEKIKFKKDNNIKKLAEEIYLYENFLPLDLANFFLKQLNSFDEQEWFIHHENYIPGDLKGDFWDGKLSPDITTKEFQDYIINYFAPDYWTYQHTNFIKLDLKEDLELSYQLDNFIEYKIALFIGECDGGEIEFQKNNLIYKPKHNDLLIFKSDEKNKHLTRKNKNGVRYAYIDMLIKHPGYWMI